MKTTVLKWTTLGLAIALLALLAGLYNFLAITRPVAANVLVVEGWLWRSTAMAEVAHEFQNGHYDWVLTVGEARPVAGNDIAPASDAVHAANRLHELGISSNVIVALPLPDVDRHRTFTSALMVRDWLTAAAAPVSGVNVFTLGTHARKSLVLYQRALGDHIPVGVFAGTEDTFDTRFWWASSRGIYVVARKAMGYVYAVCAPLPDTVPP